jgi:hypothetical protein
VDATYRLCPDVDDVHALRESTQLLFVVNAAWSVVNSSARFVCSAVAGGLAHRKKEAPVTGEHTNAAHKCSGQMQLPVISDSDGEGDTTFSLCPDVDGVHVLRENQRNYNS